MGDNDPNVTPAPAGGAPAAPAAPAKPEVIAPDYSARIAELTKDVEDVKAGRKSWESKAAELEGKVASLLKGATPAVKEKVEALWPWEWLWGD